MSVGDSDQLPHAAFHTLVLSSDASETGVKLTAVEEGTELVLVRDTRLKRFGPSF